MSLFTSSNKRSLPYRAVYSAALASVLTLLPGITTAQDCTIQETVTAGSRNSTTSVPVSSMESITSVEQITGRGSWATCPTSSIAFAGNVLTILPGCRGEFLITGKDASCNPPTPTRISPVPLFLTAQTQPNIMFLLDDSGSMHWEMMPDQMLFRRVSNGSVNYVYPRANGIYGGSDYSNLVATVDPVAYNAVTRSPQQNPIYYNPAITYQPWIKHDGTFYPEANPLCAFHSPEDRSVPDLLTATQGPEICRNLVTVSTNFNSNTWVDCGPSTTTPGTFSCQRTTAPKFYWPATYFWHSDDEPVWDYNSYTRTEIRPLQTTYTGHNRQLRSDCADAANATCTYNEEILNFANWYTYYRSRNLAAKAGIGFAFYQQGNGMRVGFGSLNQANNTVDGVDTRVIDDGVRLFEGANREAFFEKLYTRENPASGTPLRRALDTAGNYFKRTDNRGPWGAQPGVNDSTPQLSCRRNYSVLMTDGYWSGGTSHDADTDAARLNVDGTDGSVITGPLGESFQYKAASPFSDTLSNTLADVAMYYWKNDLRTDMTNNVTPVPRNPAFWQHMTTFGVGLGVTGSVTAEQAFAAIKSGATITWPDPSPGTGTCSGDMCEARIDDLLHAAINSRGGFFSAANPKQFAAELSAILNAISVESSSSATAITANSTRLDTGLLIYQARFDSRYWSSNILAFDINADGSIKSTVWDTDDAGTFRPAALRNIFTPVGTAGTRSTLGISFHPSQWANLTAYQQNALKGAGSDADGLDVLNWVRGDRSKESDTGLRVRDKILGDIVNSNPFFVGNDEDFGFSALIGTEGDAYSAFLNNESSGKKNRRAMLYVGANDGMLHGFDALTGKEIFGFVPLGVYDKLNALAQNDYIHTYNVDGTPRVTDAYINSRWKSVLVGATGAGGKAVFALDVTDPDNMGPNKLLWEFSTSSSDLDKLGVAMSAPTIIRVKANDRWVAIFGNGYESGDTVKLMIVDLATGQLVKALDTGISGIGNGLADVVPVDTNDDRITDVVYAGDLKGNLWKFDLTGNTSNQWDVAFSSGGSPAPLFRAVDRNGVAQPITSRPVVSNHEESGLMIYFGTGKFFETGDDIIPASPQVQTFYGIRDDAAVVTRSQLVEQTITYEGFAKLQNDPNDASDDTLTKQEIRITTNNGFGSPSTYGWQLDLIPPDPAAAEGERVVSRALVRDGRIIFSTSIPDPDPCGYGGTGWLMELDAATGSRLDFSPFDLNNDMLFTEGDFVEIDGVYLPVSGLGQEEMIKTPGIVGAGDVEYKFTSGSSGKIGVTREKGTGGKAGRQSWRQLR